jgi:hypothetical protein
MEEKQTNRSIAQKVVANAERCYSNDQPNVKSSKRGQTNTLLCRAKAQDSKNKSSEEFKWPVQFEVPTQTI